MTTYWLSDFCSLFNSMNINPFSGEDKNFRFNSLTRLIILITVLCAVVFSDSSNEIFLAGGISLFLSVIIYMLTYNSAEMSISLDKKLKGYLNSQKILEEKEENLKKGLSESGAEIIKDHRANVQNQVTLDYTPPNTDQKKTIYFFEGDKMPSNVTKVERDPKDYLSNGKQVLTGTTKQLHSLLKKDLSYP